jgi:hypothetical protein
LRAAEVASGVGTASAGVIAWWTLVLANTGGPNAGLPYSHGSLAEKFEKLRAGYPYGPSFEAGIEFHANEPNSA